MPVPDTSLTWLVVGADRLRSAVRRPPEWQIVELACPVDALIPAVDDSQLYLFDAVSCPAVRSRTLNQDGTVLAEAMHSPAELLRQGTNTPIGLLRPTADGVRLYLRVDSCADRHRFIRVPGAPIPRQGAVRALFAAADEHFLKVNNHLCYQVKSLPDVELEHKFTLVHNPDVSRLARDTFELADSGGLPGWLVQFREGIQFWDFMNHVYAIEQPTADAGYVSFIPTTDGRYTVKRKIFTADTDERPELRSRGVAVTDFDDHLRSVLGLTPAWHASFRRARHDVCVESIETGNVFVISYDHSTIVDDTGAAVPGLAELTQCEIEYLHSQSLAPVDFRQVRTDLAVVRTLLNDFFDRRSIANYQRHESKLTFLRRQHAGVR